MSKVKFFNNFVIEDLGEQELDVFDIEVEDNHNFFANNICVHNSMYISLEKVVNNSPVKDKSTEEIINFMDQFCEKVLYPAIKTGYEEMAEYTHSYQNKMEMAREVLADVGVYHKKKKYLLSVWDSEGVRYATPKKKVIGLELVRSSTPAVVKKEMYKLLDTVLYSTEETLQKQVSEFKKEFMKCKVEEIAIPTGVNGVNTYSGGESSVYISGTPINSRAALLHNHYIDNLKLGDIYEKISEGNRIKYLYLDKRNPTKENVIGFQGKLPVEFNLHQYIDKETMFEKAFLNACNILVEPLGWNAEEQSSLEEFFG
jgi:hypothetical protein